jgi:hypothetical protein
MRVTAAGGSLRLSRSRHSTALQPSLPIKAIADAFAVPQKERRIEQAVALLGGGARRRLLKRHGLDTLTEVAGLGDAYFVRGSIRAGGGHLVALGVASGV